MRVMAKRYFAGNLESVRIQKMGIGMIGLGGISSVHVRAYREWDLSVVAGCDVTPEGRATGSRFGLQVFEEPEDVAGHPDVHVLDVTVPHEFSTREVLLERVVGFGKPIVIQKPLANTLAEATELVEIAERAGVPLMVNQNSIFVPAFQAAHAMIQEGVIGEPYLCLIKNRSWVHMDHPIYGRRERWVLASMGIHHLALLDHWFGPWSRVDAIMGRDRSQEGVVGDTWSSVNIGFECGVCANVLNDWSIRDDNRFAHPREEVVVQGDRGTLTVQGNTIRVDNGAGEEVTQVVGEWFPQAFGNLMVHFLTSLREGTPFLCSARDNLRVIGLMEAAYRSGMA